LGGLLLDLVLRFLLGELAVLLAVDEEPGAELSPALVEESDALLDALQRVNDVALQADQDRDRVLVRAATDLLCLGLGAGDDPATLLVGRLRETAFVDQESGLLLGAGDDSLGLLLRLVDDPLAFRVDALRGANLFGYGNAELVDQAQSGVLVDDDVVGQRQLLAVGDQRLEALDQEDDVDRSVLRERGLGWRGLSHAVGAGMPLRYRASAWRKADSAAGGIIELTSPPNWAISLTRLELT
jgi:hypothetical protein